MSPNVDRYRAAIFNRSKKQINELLWHTGTKPAAYFKRAIYKHVCMAKNIRLISLPEVALLIKINMLNNLTATAFSLTWQPEGHQKNKNWPHAVDEKMKST